ncbi:MAG: UbiX family flavin prenyltransferase [Chloroflexi bacterium]|nr:UbiX family flavin prenyltransferase [Chloroflexota bacterium]
MSKLIVAISGASGSIYGIKLLEALRQLKVETILVMSRTAQEILEYETPFRRDDVAKLATECYSDDALFAPIASGSYFNVIRGMVVAPCSMKTLSSIANGYSETLIARAADVALKEGARLVLVPRETPLTAVHLKNMLALAQLGVVIMPPVPSFYDKPGSVDDIVQQTVGRVLDHFGLALEGTKRWKGEEGPRAF